MFQQPQLERINSLKSLKIKKFELTKKKENAEGDILLLSGAHSDSFNNSIISVADKAAKNWTWSSNPISYRD